MGQKDSGTKHTALLQRYVTRNRVPNTLSYRTDGSPGLRHPTHRVIALMGHQHSGTQHTELLHWYVTRTQVLSTQSHQDSDTQQRVIALMGHQDSDTSHTELLHWWITRTQVYTKTSQQDSVIQYTESPGLSYPIYRVTRTQITNTESYCTDWNKLGHRWEDTNNHNGHRIIIVMFQINNGPSVKQWVHNMPPTHFC